MKTLLTAALLAATFSSAYAKADGIKGRPTPKPSAVVLRFAIASDPLADPTALAQQACLQNNHLAGATNGANPQAALHVDPRIVDSIANELQKRLSTKFAVSMDDDSDAIPVGALVISGCITRADPGSAAGRVIGMSGKSHLDAHVKVLSKGEAGFVPVDEFDVQTTGGKKLPPIGLVGLAAHAAAERHETLSADASRLADQLLKRLATTLKSQKRLAAAIHPTRIDEAQRFTLQSNICQSENHS